jgi:hypothetical protein
MSKDTGGPALASVDDFRKMTEILITGSVSTTCRELSEVIDEERKRGTKKLYVLGNKIIAEREGGIPVVIHEVQPTVEDIFIFLSKYKNLSEKKAMLAERIKP